MPDRTTPHRMIRPTMWVTRNGKRVKINSCDFNEETDKPSEAPSAAPEPAREEVAVEQPRTRRMRRAAEGEEGGE